MNKKKKYIESYTYIARAHTNINISKQNNKKSQIINKVFIRMKIIYKKRRNIFVLLEFLYFF